MGSTEQNFSGALATWKDIGLGELQKILDAQGIEIVDNQREGVVGRKGLADKTKEFKRIPDADKLSAFKGLLKAYQTEIDNLTKRSKFAENAFLNAYKILAEAPDPYPLLEAAVDQTIKIAEARELEVEMERVRKENVELQRRFSEVLSTEATRKKAEARVEQLESKMEGLIQEKVSQKENELNATYDEKLRNYEEREQDLQKQISLARNQLRDLRTSNESQQAKLLDHSQRQDQEVVAKLAELDFIVADLDRANSRVASVERRNELLRAEVETMRSGKESSDKVRDLENQVTELEQEVVRLSRMLDTQKRSVNSKETSLTKQLEAISSGLQQKYQEVEQLKLKIKQYSDYDEIKRELEIMKYVEFAGMEDDGEKQDVDLAREVDVYLPSPNPEKVNTHRGKSLEALLAIKNKRLLEELTRFRILHGELEKSLQVARDELQETVANLDRQKQLNERLENDLLSMNTHKTNGYTPLPDLALDLLQGAELSTNGSQDLVTRQTPIPFVAPADNSILPIVTSQRDRFRQRNAELEEELRRHFSVITDLRTEIKTLQADNLKLYEKVRYMQSYREESGSRPPTSQLDPLPAPQSRLDDMSKYQARYEESMNPFEAFRGREAARAYNSLNPFERGILILTRSILGNRRTRTFFIIYALALHILVMFSTYECTASTESQLKAQPYPS